MFGGQFVFLFFAMQAGLPPGLTSVLVQLQGPLTVVLAAAASCASTPRAASGSASPSRSVGVVLIARSVDGTASLLAVGLALLSALTWAVGNLFFRLGARRLDVRRHRLGERAAADPARADRRLVARRPAALLAPILAPTWRGWFVLFYTVVPVMWLGYLIWGTLLRTYPAAQGRARSRCWCPAPRSLFASPGRRAARRPAPAGRRRRAGRRGDRRLRLGATAALTSAA